MADVSIVCWDAALRWVEDYQLAHLTIVMQQLLSWLIIIRDLFVRPVGPGCSTLGAHVYE